MQIRTNRLSVINRFIIGDHSSHVDPADVPIFVWRLCLRADTSMCGSYRISWWPICRGL